MELNKNSFSAKLYRWYFNEYEMPTNLCSYFWALVLAYITTPLFFLFAIPALILAAVDKDDDFEVRSTGYIWKAFIGFVIWVLVFFLICMVWVVIKWFSLSIPKPITAVGVVGWGLTTLITLIVFVERWKEKRRYGKPKEPSVIWEFIKAKYHKYCPQIKWK